MSILNINDRIKEVRKKLKLSQTAFGEKLGVGRGVITNIELNLTEPKDLFIDLLCKTFGVNPNWLISGTGDMFISSADNILNQLSKEYKLDPTDEAIIKTYLSFGADERKIIKRYITETAERIVSSDEREQLIAEDIAATEKIAEKIDVNMRQQTKVIE